MNKLYLISLFSSCIHLLLLSTHAGAVSTDQTLLPNSTGSPVVLAVTRKIYRSGIFEDDFFLGHRVALVSSGFGETPTLPPTTHRGIWQLTREQLEETKNNSRLTQLREQVQEYWSLEIGPSWDLVTWEDMDIPLHSGIAFRLFIETLTELSVNDPFLPSLLVDQSQFYQEHVNPSSNSSQFVDQVRTFESLGVTKCNFDADIVFVQDGSCTVYPSNFTDALTLFSNIVSFFNYGLGLIRVGHVVYSNEVVVNFGLDSGFLTEEELREALMNATRPPMQYTLTGAGISAGFNLLTNSTPRVGGIPRIIVSYTDGSAVDLLDEVTNKTMAAGVETFAVGTAFGWTNSQLEAVAHNNPGRVLKHGHTYSLSSEFLYRFNQEFCSVPTSPPLGFESKFLVVGEGERRYFHYRVQPGGGATTLNVTISLEIGNLEGFYSWAEETPDGVMNDGEISAQLGESTNNFLDFVQGEEEIHLYLGIIGGGPSGTLSLFSIVTDVL